MTRGGRRRFAPRTGPLRTCAVTRQRLPRRQLLRLVADSQGIVRIDPTGASPGRGAWVQPKAELLERLEQQPRLLGRSLRRKRMHTHGLLAQARELAHQGVLLQLQLCSRAGVVLSGRQAVQQTALQSGALAFLVLSRGSRNPLPAGPPAYELPLAPIAVGRLLGRGPRAVLGLRPSRPTETLRARLQRQADLGYCAE